MGFTTEDRRLIKCFQVCKSYEAVGLCKMFLDNEQTTEY